MSPSCQTAFTVPQFADLCNLIPVLYICKHNHFLVRLKMEHDKDHFRHQLLYCFDSKKKVSKLIDSSQELILLHQLKHVSTSLTIQK